MTRPVRSDSSLAGSILALGLILAFVGSILLGQWLTGEHHRQNFTFEHLLGSVASAVGTAIVAWWIISFAIAFLATAMHRGGRPNGANSISKFSPAFMLRLAAAILSLNLLGTGMAQAAAALPDPAWHLTSATTMKSAGAAWTPISIHGASSTVRAADDPVAPGTAVSDPRWQPRPPVIDPGLMSRPPSRLTNVPSESEVIVKDGDSLWSIAASRLGPLATDVEVALAWPKWYAANQSTIGGDPTVLLPGQVLQPPSPG